MRRLWRRRRRHAGDRAVMIALAVGWWTRRRWALPLTVGYATFASLNIVLLPDT
jgi:hypothetical protein